jgi:hypothetical protein
VVRSFRLLNQRQDVSFLFFYNVSRITKFGSNNLMAASANITLTNPNDPQHIHLAMTLIPG